MREMSWIMSGMSAVVHPGHGAAHAGLRLAQHNSQKAVVPAPADDSVMPLGYQAVAMAALVLETLVLYEPRDPGAAEHSGGRDIGSDESDRVLWALNRVALGLLDRQARNHPGDAILICKVPDLRDEVSEPAPPDEAVWPEEPLTQSETRVLRYLPTHLSAREIAAELCISAHTVRTHLRHLYRKLGAHSRFEAVRRARAAGLLAVSSRRS
jgi:LuxR family transcriptional regulator, maltose regulon positive regulatory protein